MEQVSNALAGASVQRPNLLTNGGFEVWQRGAGAFSANGAYTADRWQISLGGSDTVNVARGSGASPGNYYLSMTVTHVAGGFAALKQDLKNSDGNQFKGKTLTFSADVSSTTNLAILILAMDGTGAVNVNSPNHPGNSQWTRLSVTAPIPSDNTNVAVHLWATGSGTVMIDNAMLVVGSTPADYVPMHPADDLARCQRYYEIMYPEAFGYAVGGGQQVGYTHSFATAKAISPTITQIGTFAVLNSVQPEIGVRPGQGLSGMYFHAVSLAAGQCWVTPASAATYIVAESNP